MCSNLPPYYLVEKFDAIQSILDFSVDAVLNGITEIPKYGSPGSIIPVGGNTRAILTENDHYDTVMVIGMYGTGRFFIAGHNSYVVNYKKDIHQFYENLTKFLCPEGCSEDEIVWLDKLNYIPQHAKLLIWNGHSKKPDEMVEQLLTYLNNGGSILCGSTAWGWRQLNGYKSLDEFQFANFTAQLGVVLKTSASSGSAPYDLSKSMHKYGNFILISQKINERKSSGIDDIMCICSILCEFNKYNISFMGLVIPNLMNCLNACKPSKFPEKANPVTDENERKLVNAFCDLMYLIPTYAAPAIKNFPGQFTCSIPCVSQIVSTNAEFIEWVSTGLYAPAGQLINFAVLGGDPSQWKVRIGSHTDNLRGSKTMKRWPNLVSQKELINNLTFSSPFGGLIYLESKAKNVHIKVQISGACRAPYFDITKPETTKNWLKNRRNIGLWSEIGGKHFIFTLPSSTVVEVEDPYPFVQVWDEVIEAHHYLRGTDPYAQRRERIVSDLQPAAGYMHSGYPVVTHLDITQQSCANFVFDVQTIRTKGSWGLFHELGHNMQRGAWTFSGTGEVTVNWFSLHACLKIANQQPWTCDWMKGQKEPAKKYLLEGSDFSKWKSKPGVALCIYAELFRDFGVENFRQVLINYENMNPKEQPKADQDKIDRFILEFSNVTKRNLVPGFKLWGFPISETVIDTLKKYQDWTPVDEVTQVILNK